MGTSTSVKITERPRDRRIEAEWQTGPDQFVVLSVGHTTGRALTASLRRERADDTGGLPSRIYAPFQDIQRVGVQPIARYSAKALAAFFAEQLANVEAERDGDGPIAVYFREGTEA